MRYWGASFWPASLCWLVLWDGLLGTRLHPDLKTSDDGCFYVAEYICVVVVFEHDIWVVFFVGFRGASLRVFWGRLLVGACGGMIGTVRFVVLCVCV